MYWSVRIYACVNMCRYTHTFFFLTLPIGKTVLSALEYMDSSRNLQTSRELCYGGKLIRLKQVFFCPVSHLGGQYLPEVYTRCQVRTPLWRTTHPNNLWRGVCREKQCRLCYPEGYFIRLVYQIMWPVYLHVTLLNLRFQTLSVLASFSLNWLNQIFALLFLVKLESCWL